MKIWCDVCSKKKASVFCPADEAALCDDCDGRVHQANKLASKHQRFSLLPSSHIPLCDICQEKKALLFCQEDRAILCRDCDISIHTANELTQKHNRVLLTGIKLSALSSIDSTAKTTTTTCRSLIKSNSTDSGFDSVPDFRSQKLTTKRSPMSASSETSSPLLNFVAQPTASTTKSHDMNSQLTNNDGSGGGGGSTSSISEYLTKTLPGWQVEDLLDSFLDPNGFSKDSENDMLFLDKDLESRIHSYENMGLWVPQAPTMLQPSPFNSGIYGVNGSELAKGDTGREVSSKRMDDGFTVPEVSQQSVGSKRSRVFW